MPVRPGALPRTFGAELDPQARIEVWEAVRELARGGTTILLTTQYLDEAEQLADRIAILHEGRIIAEGTLDDLKRRFPPARVEYIEKQPLTGRSLRHILRSPDTIATTAVMPIAFLLLFVFVFGGAIQTGGESYVDYPLPGILLITVASGVAYTAHRLFLDLQGGIFERFQSMPIARSSVLWAHVLTSVVANAVSLSVVVAVAFVIGFRSPAGAGAWLAVSGILLLFTLAVTWLAVIAGLTAKTVDGASAFSYPLIFLPFLSSAFVPTETMVGHQHELRLAAHPAAHVDVAVGAAGPVGIDVEADPGLALLAVAAPAAGDVERHRDDVAHLDELHVGPHLDDLAGDLVSEHEALRRCRATPDHVLVGAADVRRHRLEDRAVRHLPPDVRRVHARPVLEFELRVCGVDHLDHPGALVRDSSVR